ncbi:hypothetical protein GCM10011488_27260 [Steroidobacter agaridevorans]|nr:hypothetical protein GCM10011488_27260 [Steroidobacter agaridevorans]
MLRGGPDNLSKRSAPIPQCSIAYIPSIVIEKVESVEDHSIITPVGEICLEKVKVGNTVVIWDNDLAIENGVPNVQPAKGARNS